MAELSPAGRTSRTVSWFSLPRLRWAPAAAVAAVALIAFIGGWWSGGQRTQTPTGDLPGMPGQEAAVTAGQRTAVDTGLRYVRLVYVPADRNVQQVTVAGSFNNWEPSATPMRRQDGAWSTILVLPPGSYEYMFVEDGNRWVTDPLAIETRADGFGGVNAVLDVES